MPLALLVALAFGANYRQAGGSDFLASPGVPPVYWTWKDVHAIVRNPEKAELWKERSAESATDS